jgi:NADH-quinone oxidoreductase subunit J
MPWDVIVFYLLAAVCITAALGVVIARNPVHSAIFLVITFFNVAGVFVMMGAEFLAVIQVIVYTGAILVLMLFVLMLVNPDDLPEFHEGRPLQRAVAGLLGVILMLEIAIAILNREVVGQQGAATAAAIDAVGGNTQALGRVLYSDYLLAFEVVSLVLTVAVIGAIVLALPERLGERIVRRQDTISLGHPRGTDVAAAIGAGTPREEAPILETNDRGRFAKSTGGRRLVMTKDPDEYTGAK